MTIVTVMMIIIMIILITMIIITIFAYAQATYELPIEPEVEAVEEVKEGKKGVETNSKGLHDFCCQL
jgi:hypothetical protein